VATVVTAVMDLPGFRKMRGISCRVDILLGFKKMSSAVWMELVSR